MSKDDYQKLRAEIMDLETKLDEKNHELEELLALQEELKEIERKKECLKMHEITNKNYKRS
jgi:hypothetical protein